MASTPCSLRAVPSESDFQSTVSALPPSSLAVIYFQAPWAAPCKHMTEVLETLASTYSAASPPSITFLSVDVDEMPDLAESYDVAAVPLVVLQRGGAKIDQVSGGDATKVRAAVERAMGGEKKAQIPPAQKVTRPEVQPVPNVNGNAAAAAPTNTKPSAANGTAKNLGAYAPDDEPLQQTPPEDMHKRLTELTNAAPVMLFMKGSPSSPQCGFSRQLVSILRENSVRYGFFNILADEEVRQGLKEYADWPTFPQLWVKGDLVGGLDIVREEMDANPEFFSEWSVGRKDVGLGDRAAPATQSVTSSA